MAGEKQIVASLGTNKGVTRIQAYAWAPGNEPDPSVALHDADLDTAALKPTQYARFVVAVPDKLVKGLGDPIDAELALFETDAGETKKSGKNKEGKALIATYRGEIVRQGGSWRLQVSKFDVPDLAAHLKDGSPSFRWTPDGERYFWVPLHASRVGSGADEKGIYEIVFELKAGKKLEKVKIAPAPLMAVLSSAHSAMTVILDLPFQDGDTFSLESSSGAVVKKTYSEGIGLGDRRLSITFDNVKPQAKYALIQHRGKAKSTVFHEVPTQGLLTSGEKPPDVMPKYYFFVDKPVPKPIDEELAGEPPDFAKIEAQEPSTK
jgi:hypothetical protein